MFPQKQYPTSPPALTPPGLKSVFVLGPALIVSLQLWEAGREGGKGRHSQLCCKNSPTAEKTIYLLSARKGRQEIWFCHISEAYVCK